jgi:hypothetical protein
MIVVLFILVHFAVRIFFSHGYELGLHRSCGSYHGGT